MKRNVVLFFLFGMLVILETACNKTEFTNPTMVPWFDTHCSSCHKKGAANAGDWKYDSKNFDKSISNYKSKLKEVVLDRKSMPPGGLTQTEIDKFKTWFDSGCPSN